MVVTGGREGISGQAGLRALPLRLEKFLMHRENKAFTEARSISKQGKT